MRAAADVIPLSEAVLLRLGSGLDGAGKQLGRINLQGPGDADERFDGWCPQLALHVAHHLVGQARPLADGVQRKRTLLACGSQEPGKFRTERFEGSGRGHELLIIVGRLDGTYNYGYVTAMFIRRLLPTEAAQPCRSTSGCPDLWELADGDFAVIGEDITAFSDKLPPTAGCAPHERIVRVPRELLVRARPVIPSQL